MSKPIFFEDFVNVQFISIILSCYFRQQIKRKEHCQFLYCVNICHSTFLLFKTTAKKEMENIRKKKNEMVQFHICTALFILENKIYKLERMHINLEKFGWRLLDIKGKFLIPCRLFCPIIR